MGGDHAPDAMVAGVLTSRLSADVTLLLVGQEERLRPLLVAPRAAGGAAIEIVPAADVVAMQESPVQAVRGKPNSSLVVCAELVRRGEAEAMVSAGNTGAALAAGALKLGRIRGVDRPAITCLLPNRRGFTVLLDAGANVDVGPQNLLQFALMGEIYAREVLGVSRPRVGLLNVCEEATKGNRVVQSAYPLLAEAPIQFVGNIEGPDLFDGGTDVAVCDGFVGNIVLKVGEGAAEFLRHLLREEVLGHPIMRFPALLMKAGLRRIVKRTDYREVGGAPLLGVNGVCIISHGRSNAVAIANALDTAEKAVTHGVIDKIRAEVGTGVLAGNSGD